MVDRGDIQALINFSVTLAATGNAETGPMRSLGIAVALTVALAAAPAAAAVYAFNAKLSGAAEAPPNTSPGSGFGVITFDDVLHQMTVDVDFVNLLAGVTAAHIHAATVTPFTGTAGVATQTPTFSGFPNGVTRGSYFQTFDMTLASSYRAGYLNGFGGSTAAAEAALITAAKGGQAYLNIHSSLFPGGEVRGFLTPVPELGTWALMLLGFGAAGAMLRARRPVINPIG
jgi:opacity protein-like surface antigen